ncbi:MAG: radical SAM protein, partial [Bacilli bacterium]
VTPTPYVFEIKKALIIAKEKGLTLPVIYNTSSYEDVKTIKLLKGFIDIYLPDLKYFDDLLAIKFSKAPNYFYYATNAIKEMVLQVGKPLFDSDGNLIKGVIVRHLVLPNHTDDSKKIIKYLYDTYHDDIFISIMNQYTPLIKTEDSDLNRCLTKHEYNKVVNYAISLGVTNAFIQDEGTNKTSFIPPFDLEGV